MVSYSIISNVSEGVTLAVTFPSSKAAKFQACNLPRRLYRKASHGFAFNNFKRLWGCQFSCQFFIVIGGEDLCDLYLVGATLRLYGFFVLFVIAAFGGGQLHLDISDTDNCPDNQRGL